MGVPVAGSAAEAIFNLLILGNTGIWIISIAMILRRRLKPVPALLWVAWSILIPLGGLITILYFITQPKNEEHQSSRS